MNLRRRVALTLLAALFALAFPAAASAVVYTVDSTGDQEDLLPGTGGCVTSAATCTLRAAIEESNASPTVTDEIRFSSAFDGEQADSTIAVGSALPDIEDELTIDGDGVEQCETDAGVDGPCVGVKGESRLEVEADEVMIEGLSITDFQIAITVEAEKFEAHGNWIGIELDGTDGPEEQSYGIFVGPNADQAVIGGTTPAARNVFGNTNSGLLLRGASFGTVLGNYFGVGPNGTTAAPNGRNLVVANKLEVGDEVEATNNQIGADVGEAGTGTAACDFGCNVFASQSNVNPLIDLVGTSLEEEGPATGPTQVEGNYVGLDATGAEMENSATFDVMVGGSGGATIGGEANGQANYIVGGGTAIYHEDGKDFAAIGNIIGDGPTAADVKAPGLGVFTFCLDLGTESADSVAVSGNVFDMEGGTGVETVFGNVDIEDNFIEGADTGIFTRGDPPGVGSLIEGNVIGESAINGILIESDFNTVLDNAIYGSGEAGVLIRDPTAFPLVITTGNLIGGTSAGEENTIRESGEAAVEIVDISGNTEEDSYNAVGRNKGDSNAGFFIDLVGNANAGIEPPDFTSEQSSASGSGAEPNATIRVFRKKTSQAGEIESFLGEAEADGSGNWKVTYAAAIPGGTNVAATQTSVLGGTSELSFATVPPEPSGGGGGGTGTGGGGTGGTKLPDDTTPPTAKITKAPKAKSTSTTAKFKFKSNEAGSAFQCKLDKGKFKKCKSPKTYRKLKLGKHVFKVRAIDKAGNVGKAAKRKFTVLASS